MKMVEGSRLVPRHTTDGLTCEMKACSTVVVKVSWHGSCGVVFLLAVFPLVRKRKFQGRRVFWVKTQQAAILVCNRFVTWTLRCDPIDAADRGFGVFESLSLHNAAQSSSCARFLAANCATSAKEACVRFYAIYEKTGFWGAGTQKKGTETRRESWQGWLILEKEVTCNWEPKRCLRFHLDPVRSIIGKA